MSLPYPDPDETVLVTGASSGIGSELARQLASRGHGVTIVARREDRLEELATELRDRHRVPVDVKPSNLAAQRARSQLIKELRQGDRAVAAVCNCAGFGTHGLFHELSLAREAEQVRVNVEALHELTGAFLPEMVKRGAGAILNIASTAGFQPLPTTATYAATKAFVVTFSEAVHTELAGTGVSVTALCPGPVRTEWQEVANMDVPSTIVPDVAWVSATDVARAAVDGMIKGKRIVIPGAVNRVGAAAAKVTPHSLLLPIVNRFAPGQRGGNGDG